MYKTIQTVFARTLPAALLVFALNTQAHQAHNPDDRSCARYLGNEGILVTAGKAKILFDALYAENYGQYALVPEATHQALIAGHPPYDGIDALFVSHVHGDHFSPAPTLEYLRAQDDVVLYASEQVINVLIEAGAGDDVKARLKPFILAAGDPAQSVSAGPLTIDVVRIPHAGGERTANIENLAFRVSLNDEMTVLHMGDADPKDDLFAPHQAHWDATELDAAFPPYWFFGNEEGRSILEQRLKAGQTIGIHVPIEAEGEGDAWRARFQGDLFTDPGEMRALSENGCGGHNAGQ